MDFSPWSLQFNKRPLLLVDRHIEYFNYDLQPFVHYIPVKEDLSDLLVMTKWIHDNRTIPVATTINAQNYAIENFTEDNILDKIYGLHKNMIHK